MTYSKFNKVFLIGTVVALGVIAGVQGCSSSDSQVTPTGGAAGALAGGAVGKAGAGNKAGASNGGTGNETGGMAGVGNEGGMPEGGAGGEAGATSETPCNDFLNPCTGPGSVGMCEADFDNSTLTKLVHGKLPALP